MHPVEERSLLLIALTGGGSNEHYLQSTIQTSTNFLLPDRPSFPIILFELSQYGSEFPREIEGRVGLPFIEYT